MGDNHQEWTEHAAQYEAALPYEHRKRDGVWFTPMELALPTALRTLQPLIEQGPDRLRICDPAVGGGSLLLAAANALRATDVKQREFAGVDLDENAAAIAKRALHDLGERHVDISRGDGLTDLANESFDCVLTNPPWETLQDGPDRKARVASLRPRFHHQGKGKLYTYRLFLERAVQLLRGGGRLGAIVPAGLWFDRGANPLRQLLLESCDWQWLFGFENRERIFDIDSRYRFGVIVATKGKTTNKVRVAFGRTKIADWACGEPQHVSYQRDELQRLSPHSGAIVEVDTHRDLAILTRMQERGTPLLDGERALAWRQGDFNMTSARDQFVQREHAERDGYRHNGLGLWQRRGDRDLIALRQGAMIYDLQANAGAHDSGTGHKTKWRAPSAHDDLRPLYLVDATSWHAASTNRPPARIALRALSNATNERTAIACLLPDVPCGNSLGVISPHADVEQPVMQLAATTAMLGSLPFDWALRMRLAGTNLNRFVLADCVLPSVTDDTHRELATLALRMCATTRCSASLWRLAQNEGWCNAPSPAIDADERRKLATRIDVLVGRALGLHRDDVEWICRGKPFAKGFWRIETELPAEERRPSRWLLALSD